MMQPKFLISKIKGFRLYGRVEFTIRNISAEMNIFLVPHKR